MEIETKIEINAPAQVVWDILMDFGAYPDWNTFVQRISGGQTVGSNLEVFIVPPGGSSMTFKPKVIVNKPNEEFKWLGKLLFSGLFDGAHRFQIREIDTNRIEFIHTEKFSGILVPIFKNSILESTTAGFEAMNSALKQRAETS